MSTHLPVADTRAVRKYVGALARRHPHDAVRRRWRCTCSRRSPHWPHRG